MTWHIARMPSFLVNLIDQGIHTKPAIGFHTSLCQVSRFHFYHVIQCHPQHPTPSIMFLKYSDFQKILNVKWTADLLFMSELNSFAPHLHTLRPCLHHLATKVSFCPVKSKCWTNKSIKLVNMFTDWKLKIRSFVLKNPLLLKAFCL